MSSEHVPLRLVSAERQFPVEHSFSTKAMSPRRAQLLRTGGILYAPDYVIKGGGGIAPSRLGSTGFSIRTSGTDTPPVASSSRSSGRNPYAV